MKDTTHWSVPAHGHGIAKHLTIAVFSAAALVMIFTLAQASVKPEPVAADATTDRWAQCEHDGGIALESLASNGLDLRTAKIRRERERAIQACRDGFPDLRWLAP
jgi:hypothetical protein